VLPDGRQPSCFAYRLAAVKSNLIFLKTANLMFPSSNVQLISYFPFCSSASWVKTPALRFPLSTPSVQVLDNEAHCHYNARRHSVAAVGRSRTKGGEERCELYPLSD